MENAVEVYKSYNKKHSKKEDLPEENNTKA